MDATLSVLSRIRDHIAGNELAEALKLLRTLLQHTPQLNEVLQQSGRLASIRQQARIGALSSEDAKVSENQIRYGVLQLLSEMEANATPAAPLEELFELIEKESGRPALRAEIQQAVSIVNSRNIVSGTVSAGGNVHIGDIIHTTSGPRAEPIATYEFNKQLTRTLVEAMQPYHDKAKKLCADFSWLEHPDNLRKVQQFVFRNFVGEIGKQLRNLVNIGADNKLAFAQKEKHYVSKCLNIAKRSLDLVNFALVSQWWEAVKIAPRALDDEQRRMLNDFFNKDLEHPLHRQCTELGQLRDLFLQHEIALPFPELETMGDELQPDSDLHRACRELEVLAQSGDCREAENNLAEILRHFAFLTRYRMVSIKRIVYRQIRNGLPEYLHRYVALGIDVKYSEDAEKGNWISVGEQTPAVMLFAGDDYSGGVNLFPFVIDLNALTFEQGAKICFFSANDLSSDHLLEYRFLSDNSIERIERKGILRPETNLSELMMDDEKLKVLNLDCVVDTFLEARAAVLGKGDDFFDNL